MKRILAGIFVCVLTALVRSDVPRPRDPILPASFALTAEAVVLDSSDPARKRLGRLTWLGGWALSADSAEFGGISALDMQRGHAVALSDKGSVVRFTQLRDASFTDGTVSPIPNGCSRNRYKSDQDTESLARQNPDGVIWAGLEARNMICRFDPALHQTTGAVSPLGMARWSRGSGAEAMVWLASGRLAVFAESPPGSGTALTPVLIFDGDPVDAGTKVEERLYKAPQGFRPVDAARLPDGRVLVLNRRFRLPYQFTAVLVLIDPAQFAGAGLVEGAEVARFEPPVITDNFEALSVETTKDATLVWIASDDNFQWPQRNLLLKFRWQD